LTTCVLLAEPHHGLAEGTRVLLGTRFDAVVMVADESSLREIAERVKPILLVVDLGFLKKDLVRGISCIRERSPESKIIVATNHDEPAVARAVLDAGADGVLVKRRIGSELMSAIDAVLRGERYVCSKSRSQSDA
jgi:two-component system NarL family response regulator